MRANPSYKPRQIRQKKLRPNLLTLLQRFANGLEQIGFQTGKNARTAHALYKRGYLVVIAEQGHDWRSYDITETGRAALRAAIEEVSHA